MQYFTQAETAGHRTLHDAHLCIEHLDRTQEGKRVVGAVKELNIAVPLSL